MDETNLEFLSKKFNITIRCSVCGCFLSTTEEEIVFGVKNIEIKTTPCSRCERVAITTKLLTFMSNFFGDNP